MRVFAVSLAMLLLAGCNKPQISGPQSPASAPAPPAEIASDVAAPGAASAPLRPANPGSMLAYTYDFSVEAPSAHIRQMVEHEQAACTAAGPTVCAVTGSSVDEVHDGDTTATMTLKVAPNWMPRLKAELANDLADAGGHFTKTGITSEDLAVQIVDADAHVKSQAALRDRLQEALQQRPGKVSDFVDVANALAKAQGDLDAMQSEVALLRQRVAMSDVTVNYSSTTTLASGSTWAPLSSAIGGFTGLLAMGLAAMITIIGIVLPWAIVTGAAGWIFVTLRRRKRGGGRPG